MEEKEVWIPSYCNNCYNGCQTRVLVEDGVITRIAGAPGGFNEGRLCPRGNAMIMTVYDPNRIRTPLKRTNPEKGIGIDPEWVEISYEEAIDILTEKIKKAREKNPNLVRFGSMDNHCELDYRAWAYALGTPQAGWHQTTGGVSCGNGEHMLGEIIHGSFGEFYDYRYCNYLILWATAHAGEGWAGLGRDAERLAEARKRGMKLVVIDPRFTPAASKADEWIPIRPGTDGALQMGIINLLVNEFEIYDEKFLKLQTNAPYLIAPDGYYLRDKNTKKPLIWDNVEGKEKTFDDPSIKDYALGGTYNIDGIKTAPAFQLLKDVAKDYTPERVEEITAVPSNRIKKLAREWGEYAQIGSKIVVEGKTYPLRPVAIVADRGHQAHRHSYLDTLGLYTLRILVGALDVPGGAMRIDIYMTMTGTISTELLPADKDGMVRNRIHLLEKGEEPTPMTWPPTRYDLNEYFPSSITGNVPFITLADPKRFGLPDKDIVSIYHHTNPIFSGAYEKQMAEALKTHFVVVCDLYLSETAELADLFFPESTFLERWVTQGQWHWEVVGKFLAQPVIEPLYGLRDFSEVLMEVAERAGFLYEEGGMNWWLNTLNGLEPPFQLNLNEKYSYKEIIRHVVENSTKGEKDFQWFLENGCNIRPAKAEELYQPYGNARIPLYMEWIKKFGDNLKKFFDKHEIEKKWGIEWDFSDYLPVPCFKPYLEEVAPKEYDMTAISYRTVLSSYGRGPNNPILLEQQERDPYLLKVMMQKGTAQKKGIQDDDLVFIEGWNAGKIRARVKLTEALQPETLAIASIFGHWAKGGVGYGKGPHFNTLVPLGLEHIDKITGNWEHVNAKVKVYKA